MREFFAASVEDTELAGEKLGAVLKDGDVVLLNGELGAGKTAFTRGIARGMGIGARVKSPTFTILREYGGRLFHFDLYRVSGEDELFDIGFESFLGRGVCVIEWPDVASELIGSHIRVDIEYIPGGRRIRLDKDIL